MSRFALYSVAGTLLTLFLQSASVFLGAPGALFHLFVPLPAAYAAMRQGVGAGGAIVVLTSAALFALGGAKGVLAYLLQFGLVSVLLPLLLRRGRSWDAAVAWTLGAGAGVALTGAAAFAAARGVSVGEMVSRFVKTEVDRAMELYAKAQLPPEQMKELESLARQMADFLAATWPGLAVLVTGGVLLLTVFLLSAFSAGRYEVPGPPFRLWKAPELLIWVLILGGAGALLAKGWPQRIAMNLTVVVLPVYFLQGLAIVTWFFRTKNVSPFFRNLGYLLVVILNPLPLIVTGMGVFDLWVDFRKSSGIKKA